MNGKEEKRFYLYWTSFNDSRDWAEYGEIDACDEMTNSPAYPLRFGSEQAAREHLRGILEAFRRDERVAARIDAGLLTFEVCEE